VDERSNADEWLSEAGEAVKSSRKAAEEQQKISRRAVKEIVHLSASPKK